MLSVAVADPAFFATLEVYYQEAGRDGLPARCVLLYDPRDRRTQLFLMGGRYPSAEEVREVYDVLQGLRAEPPVPLARIREAAAGVSRDKVRVVLSLMKEVGIVREQRGSRFSLRREALGAEELTRMAREWKNRAEADRPQ